MKVKSRIVCPIKKNGSWTAVIKEFEEEIPDLGREHLICNKCGWPDYPKCKEMFCTAWIQRSKQKKINEGIHNE